MPFTTFLFRQWQIFASNTDVGKTVITAGLCRAALRINPTKQVYYLKPVQTGYPVDDDASFVARYARRSGHRPLIAKTLFSYPDPVSPHIATDAPPSDDVVLGNVRQYLTTAKRRAENGEGFLFLETAGGVLSPLMSGTPQATAFRPFRLPTILVGDSRLGGISATLSAYESLTLRGYDVARILLFDDPSRDNARHLRTQLSIHIDALPVPPPKEPDAVRDGMALRRYFESTEKEYASVFLGLEKWHTDRWTRLRELGPKTAENVWWPFTQHGNVTDGKITVIDSAYEDRLITYHAEDRKNSTGKNGSVTAEGTREQFDACASWWTQGLGHGNVQLSLKAAQAAGRYGHLLFPECAHEPALLLAERLLSTVGRPWASRVFYSDNGSTGMEVALKMAIKSAAKRYGESRVMETGRKDGEMEVIGIDGGYHGDTIGTMDACGPNVYNQEVPWYRPRGHWFQPPIVLFQSGIHRVHLPSVFPSCQDTSFPTLSALFDFSSRLNSPLADTYRNHIRETLSRLVEEENRRFGVLLMEPILMGAGGMLFVDPLFQRCLVEEVRGWPKWSRMAVAGKVKQDISSEELVEGSWKGLPVVFDEVFTGLWRLGRRSGALMLEINPDVACYAKLLTGGILPLAVTLTTPAIFQTFLGEQKYQALLHGHSYTAHPIGCAVAAEAIRMMENIMESAASSVGSGTTDAGVDMENDERWAVWSLKTAELLSHHSKVHGVVRLGTVLAITLKDKDGAGYTSQVSASLIESLRARTKSQETGLENPGIFARPLGNVVYLMASLTSRKSELRDVEKTLLESLE